MSISFDEIGRVFCIRTVGSEYQMKIHPLGYLLHTYYGKWTNASDMSYLYREADRGFSGNPYEAKMNRGISLDTMPQEAAGFGTGDYRVPAIRTTAACGSMSLELKYESHTIEKGKKAPLGLPHVRENADEWETLSVTMVDCVLQIAVILHYAVCEKKDILVRYMQVQNRSKAPVYLDKAASVCIDFMHAKLDLISFPGRYNMERSICRQPIRQGIFKVSSTRGASSHQQNPFVILCSRDANENQGECYGFMPVYSGNHATEAELDHTGTVRLVQGIHEEGFRWKLEGGETFDTPESILAYSAEGLNGLSFLYHRIIRENVCPSRFLDRERKVLVNTWEATYFTFDTDKLIAIADAAHDAGIEMLVLDDGWFGKRDNDLSGLGDWFINEKKLPGGLTRLADHLASLGMQFGLWVEPEMVSEDSDLYRAHSDWALKDPERLPNMSRHQLVLDLSREEVVSYLFARLDAILSSAKIQYLKWDFNRSLANVYSAKMSSDAQGEVSHRFILGTYQLLESITKAHPDVMIEGCSGGGGRFDAGMLYYTPQIWCSDNTDAACRIEIQKGTSYGYPICAMGSHVSTSPNHQTGRSMPFRTRGVVALAGNFGYELDPTQLSDAEKEEIREQIALFHQYDALMQNGRYYRLSDEEDERYFSAWGFVADDLSQALVSLVVTKVKANPTFSHIKVRGLKEDAVYAFTINDESYELTGAALSYGGLAIPQLYGDFPAVMIHFVRK